MALRKFKEIEKMAAGLQGGPKALQKRIEEYPMDAKALKQSDDRFFATMTRMVFCAGFNWGVIDKKWDGFEAAFDGFDPHRVAFYGDDDMERLLGDAGIVRNGPKIKSTLNNARFVVDVVKEFGSFSKFLKGWPATDQVGLMAYLKKNGDRLGGNTGQYFLRYCGYDGFILSQDVGAAFIREGVVDNQPTGKGAMQSVQEAFNVWAEESSRARWEISRILALSVG